jgi:hypothetical protein
MGSAVAGGIGKGAIAGDADFVSALAWSAPMAAEPAADDPPSWASAFGDLSTTATSARSEAARKTMDGDRTKSEG